MSKNPLQTELSKQPLPLHIQHQNQLNQQIQQLNSQLPLYEKTNNPQNQTHITILPPSQPPLVRSQFDSPLRVDHHNTEPSMTDVGAQDECDINLLLERFNRTGVLEHTNTRQPQYGDFTNIPSLRESMQQVINAEALFMELPAKLRERFKNDPFEFLEYANDPDNIPEMTKLGLIKPQEATATTKTTVPVTPESPEPKKSNDEAPKPKSKE